MNDEGRMTNQIRNLNVEGNGRLAFFLDFGHQAAFGFRHSEFVIVHSLPTSAATES